VVGVKVSARAIGQPRVVDIGLNEMRGVEKCGGLSKTAGGRSRNWQNKCSGQSDRDESIGLPRP
jgi:hypothetical protein